MHRLVVLLLALVALTAPAAAAAAPYPLNVTAITPAAGNLTALNVPAFGAGSQAFEVTTDLPGLSALTVEVATQNVPGQDGTLADDYAVPLTYGYMSARDSNPAVYTGSVTSSAWSRPGTYYVQVHGTRYSGCPGGTSEYTCLYASSVYTYTVVAPPAAPVVTAPAARPAPTPAATPVPAADDTPSTFMSLLDAKSYVKPIIRRQTSHSPAHLKYGCQRVGSDEFGCGSSWYDARNIWAVTFDLVDTGNEISWSGSGLRATRSCLKRHSVKRCAKKVEWS
jgi:hypothetical protein